MENKHTQTKKLITSLLQRISTLESEIEDMSNLSFVRQTYIYELEGILYPLRCAICGQYMDIVSKIEPHPPRNKGEMIIQEVILTCSHPRKD